MSIMYSGDEECGDDITSGVDRPEVGFDICPHGLGFDEECEDCDDEDEE